MRRRAFTLIELLVVVSIISILVAILLPALGRAKYAAATLRCITHVRNNAQAMATYSTDYNDSFPFFARRSVSGSFNNAGVVRPVQYMDQSIYWVMVVRPYLGDRQFEATQFCPSSSAFKSNHGTTADTEYRLQFGEEEDYTHSSHYRMSLPLFTTPKMWSDDGDARDTTQMRPVNQTDVAFPSAKGLMVEAVGYHLPPVDNVDEIIWYRTPSDRTAFSAAFVDGSAGSVRPGELTPGVRLRNLARDYQRPLLATPDGYLGRDDPSGGGAR